MAAEANHGLNPHVTRSEPPKDRLSKFLDRQNGARFGWQVWPAARAQYPRFAYHACPLVARLSAERPLMTQLQSLPHYQNPTHGFLGPRSAGGQTPLPAIAAVGPMAAA